jgi:hypothetical protein
VGHLYKAKPQLAAFYQELDLLRLLNPGIGGTPRLSGAPPSAGVQHGTTASV